MPCFRHDQYGQLQDISYRNNALQLIPPHVTSLWAHYQLAYECKHYTVMFQTVVPWQLDPIPLVHPKQ